MQATSLLPFPEGPVEPTPQASCWTRGWQHSLCARLRLCVLPLTTLHLDLGGWDLTDDLMEMLTELGYFFITIGDGWGG